METRQLQVSTKNKQLWDQITVGDVICVSDGFHIHHGILRSETVRTTVFSQSLADQARFRAAFRTDIDQLELLEHPSIAQTIGWGEHDGTIFYVSRTNDAVCLNRFLEDNQLSWEEFVDIAWQISSALQHAHNSGLAHSGLTQETILIDSAFRVCVCDFGLERWFQQTTQPDVVPSYQDSCQSDLIQFGILLEQMMELISDEAVAAGHFQMAEIRNLIEKSQNPRNNVMARDFQGHLGDLLLNEAGEVIDMVDRREGQQTSRRSIVDELFDDEEQFQPFQKADVPLPVKPDYVVAGLILALVALVAVLLALQ